MKLVKGKMYWIKSEQMFGSFISGCEFDVDGGLGLYDIEQDVVDVAELEAENAELKAIIVDLRESFQDFQDDEHYSNTIKNIVAGFFIGDIRKLEQSKEKTNESRN